MKTLVMFEAFGGKLRSEPEVMDIALHGPRIEMPLPLGRPWIKVPTPEEILWSKTLYKRAVFEYVDTVSLPNWAHPIRKYVLVDV